MKVVSRYVREQKRYTKNDLKSKFSFDEDGVEKFIKNLKSSNKFTNFIFITLFSAENIPANIIHT